MNDLNFEDTCPTGQTMSDHARLCASVVIPMMNEAGSIITCLKGFSQQTYGTESLDVMVVDGGSTDGSRQEVDEFASDRSWCRVLDNPRHKAAAAFNIGVENARGDVVFIFSAHGVPAPGYVEESIRVLGESGASGVGGQYHHVGTDPVSNAVGCAMVSPVGMASPHRTVTARREVDTISHPAYVLDAARASLPFDETLERNSDYEFNYRMRRAGHRLIVDPSIESVYRPRPSLRALARQFWWYGRWKERVIRRDPRSLKARHLVPPAAVALGVSTPMWIQLPGTRVLAKGMLLAYAALVAYGVQHARPREHGADPRVLAFCFPIMHASWGAGFLASVVEDSVVGGRR